MSKQQRSKEELEIEIQILTWLNKQAGCFAFKIETTGFYDTKNGFWRKRTHPFYVKGTADIIGMKNGVFFAIEVKSPEGVVSSDQLKFIKQVVKKKGYATVCRSLLDAKLFYRDIH